jgi:hypothetical protein
MKTFILICLMPFSSLAEAPRKPLPSRYTSLHTSSPFTTPAPPVITDIPIINPLEDWALVGVTKFPDGYFVILANKKKPDEKTVIQPGMPSDFEVLEVIEDSKDYTQTIVRLKYGTSTGSVTFDKKNLTVKTPQQERPSSNTVLGVLPALGNNERGDRGGRGDRSAIQSRLRTLGPTNNPSNQGSSAPSNGAQPVPSFPIRR